MGRNEIRLRRKRMTASGADRFRNYGNILERHEKEQRLRKVLKVFGMFVIALILVMIILILSRWESRPLSQAVVQPFLSAAKFPLTT